MTNPRMPFVLSTDRPAIAPLDGHPLIVHVVLNVEHWQFDVPMPRAILSSPHGTPAIPDVPNFSWVEYGLRAGLPRLLRMLSDRAIPFGVPLNSSVIDAYPAVADALAAADTEFIGHGVTQQSLHRADDERAVISETLDRIERFTGVRPRGWLGPGLQETYDTPDVLRELGVDHVFDWTVDDLPTWMTTTHGPLLSVPYSLEFNDSLLHAVEHHSSDELLRRVVATLAVFETELASQPRILTLPLHPHLFGVPHRIGSVAAVLDLLQARNDTIFVTGSAIADWYGAAEPPPAELLHAELLHADLPPAELDRPN
jgi:allantoinase